MREIKVRDDGNCLFYAVALQLEKDETTHSKIREDVVNWLLHNSDYLIVCYLSIHYLFYSF